jgi:predicted phosphoadenosine phosphosulfate sulfurtransferase
MAPDMLKILRIEIDGHFRGSRDVPKFGHWYAGDVPTAIFVGIRAAESLHRWRAVTRACKNRLEGKSWTTWKGDEAYNVYPIYDFRHARSGDRLGHAY